MSKHKCCFSKCTGIVTFICEWSGRHEGKQYTNSPSEEWPTVGWCEEHLGYGKYDKSKYSHNGRKPYFTVNDFFEELE